MDKNPPTRLSPLRCALFLLLAGLLLQAAGCRERTESAAPVLLQVNGRVVTLDDFNRRFERTLPPENTLGQDEKDELRRSFLRQVIDRELALAEAQRLGLGISPEEVEQAMVEFRRDYPEGGFDRMLRAQGTTPGQWRDDLETQLLVDKVLAQAVYSRVSVDDGEIAGYYQENREEFVRPRTVRARQIMVDNEEQGEEILAQLQKGASFEEMARRFSLSPDGEDGGDLGFFPAGEMPPEFDQVVFSLPVGQLSELVRSDYGYHIFLVDEQLPAQNLSLQQATPEIRRRLRRLKEEEAYQSWLTELSRQAQLEVNWPLL